MTTSETIHPACQFRSDKPWLDKQFHDIEQTSIKKPGELTSELQDPESKINEQLLNRILGSIIGLLLGDALGAHVEFRPHDFLKANPVTELQGGGTWGLEKGQFTDDTSMALCLMNSLIARHGFVPYDQLVRYKWWYKHGYMSSTGLCFDIGSATSQSIREFERRQTIFANENNIPLDQLDYLSDYKLLNEFNVYCSQEDVAGNGALMRLAPVPLFFHRNPKIAVQYSGISGRITHGDQKAYDSCCYFGALIVATLRGETKNDLLSNRFYDDHKDWFNDEPLHPDVQHVADGSFKRAGGYEDGIRGKGYIVSALEAALWAFWSDEDSFEKGALAAVNLGDDTDTTAAIYGALAGTYYGYKNLPQKWLDSIYAKNFIICLCKWMTYEAEKFSDGSIDRHDSEDHSIVERTFTEQDPITMEGFPPIIISTPPKMPSIQRTAIDPVGKLGSLYDAYRDRLIVQSDNIVKKQQLSVLTKTMKCFVRKGNSHEHLNLLQMIDITNELRLSVEFNITPALGIAKTINYSLPIDVHTRFLYYNYLDREESLFDNTDDSSRSISASKLKTQATHVVTGVSWGIEVLAILQLSPDDASKIDNVLNQIRQYLTNNDTNLDMTLDEKHLLNRINRTTIYSNIYKLTKITNVLDLYCKIVDGRMNRTRRSPLTYTLCPIRFLYPEYSERDVIYIALEPRIIEKIELYLLSLSFQFKILKKLLERKSFQSSDEYLCQQFLDAQNQFSNLEKIYTKQMKTFQDWIIDIRKGKISSNVTIQELIDNDQNGLKEAINNIIIRLNSLKERGRSLHDRQITQTEHDSYNDHHDANIKYQSTKDERNENFKYPMDTSDKKFDQNSSSFVERETYHESVIPYIDRPLRSDSTDELLLDDKISTVHVSHSKTSWSPRTHPESSSLIPTEETTNILLLGEIGVGKSTFINAFANYYSFDTFDSAQFDTPVVVTPSSFLITTRDSSVISIHARLGTSNSNEIQDNYDHSTTQQCKSYLFHMHDGTKIRFIDTPGLGDMDGWNQDHLQIQNILSFINNLPYLNAVCFLLKPNFSRFSVYESCFQRLFTFFGENIRQNIIFCFTHSFSMQFNSTDGIRLFESQLKSISNHGIRMKKESTFYFDSESFRYLVALHNSIEFDDASMYHIKSSWSKSKIEAIRFLRYIKMQLIPFQIDRKCQSIEHAQLEIQYMIRPMLETMRNRLRNHLLWTRDSSNTSIELCPKAISSNIALCLSCQSHCDRFGKFWICLNKQHKLDRNKCFSCICNLKRHVSIDYQLDYKLALNQRKYNYNEMTNIIELIKLSAYFANVLLCGSDDSQNDPFLFSIDQMIKEEYFIYSHYHPNIFNLKLYDSLKDLKRHYQQDMEEMSNKQRDYIDLSRIDERIKYVSTLPMIDEQINAIKQSRELFIIEHEYQVSLKNKRKS
ncbi:unnamed protein product [Rotaria sordida]|uniref:AIG1-type G domain-containing protein n=1 Tax=Rotaria sordida TaxID=392033 RepID=A0A814KHK3_9BILA|nr:unnamed protein product [Rotaria sordida]